MIARTWQAITTPDKLPGYLETVRESVLPRLLEQPGYQGSRFMTRLVDNQIEIQVVTYWNSMDDAQALSGQSSGGAWMPAEIEAVLEQFDHDVALYEVMIDDSPE
jgi:heme-degrading monooxygenase HmoA